LRASRERHFGAKQARFVKRDWEQLMADGNTRSDPYNVLFLCTGNSARSIMAEAILTRIGAGKFRAFSAGSFPKGQVHPRVVQILKTLNYQPDLYRSKSWDEFARPSAPKLDFVFTVCDRAAKEVCPVWPGQPMSAHWGLPDPAAATGSETEVAIAFGEAWRMLQNRITIFAALPIAGLDRLSLQTQIDAIGKVTEPTPRARAE
jgi:arsenate reductase (thioredoxin)